MNISELITFYDKLHRMIAQTSEGQATPPLTPEKDAGHNQDAESTDGTNYTLHPLNPFNVPDKHFELCFGFPKNFAWSLCQLLMSSSNMFSSKFNGKKKLPFQLRLLATLSFLHHGHFEHVLALEAYRISSINKLLQCVAHECEIIVLFLTPSFVKFPSEPDETRSIKEAFLRQFGVPGVVGVLDCFFVRMLRTSESERENFTNRLGQLAVNVQVICDHNYRFLDVNARFPGSCSDIYIWNHSHVFHIMRHLQIEHPLTWLVADRGYHLNSVIVNPYRNPSTLAQKTLNKDLKEVRSVLDNALAILRSRFRCLNMQLPFQHRQCSNIITACVTLHNYLLANGYPIMENLIYHVPQKRDLPNSLYEDVCWSGTANREYVKEFLANNHLKEQISMSRESNIY